MEWRGGGCNTNHVLLFLFPFTLLLKQYFLKILRACTDLPYFRVPETRQGGYHDCSLQPTEHAQIVRVSASVLPQTPMRKDREKTRGNPSVFPPGSQAGAMRWGGRGGGGERHYKVPGGSGRVEARGS